MVLWACLSPLATTVTDDAIIWPPLALPLMPETWPSHLAAIGIPTPVLSAMALSRRLSRP